MTKLGAGAIAGIAIASVAILGLGYKYLSSGDSVNETLPDLSIRGSFAIGSDDGSKGGGSRRRMRRKRKRKRKR